MSRKHAHTFCFCYDGVEKSPQNQTEAPAKCPPFSASDTLRISTQIGKTKSITPLKSRDKVQSMLRPQGLDFTKALNACVPISSCRQ